MVQLSDKQKQLCKVLCQTFILVAFLCVVISMTISTFDLVNKLEKTYLMTWMALFAIFVGAMIPFILANACENYQKQKYNVFSPVMCALLACFVFTFVVKNKLQNEIIALNEKAEKENVSAYDVQNYLELTKSVKFADCGEIMDFDWYSIDDGIVNTKELLLKNLPVEYKNKCKVEIEDKDRKRCARLVDMVKDDSLQFNDSGVSEFGENTLFFKIDICKDYIAEAVKTKGYNEQLEFYGSKVDSNKQLSNVSFVDVKSQHVMLRVSSVDSIVYYKKGTVDKGSNYRFYNVIILKSKNPKQKPIILKYADQKKYEDDLARLRSLAINSQS